MSDKMLEKLMEAREIIAEADRHYDRADELELLSLKAKKKTRRKIIFGAIGASIFSLVGESNMGLLTLVMEAALVVAVIAYVRHIIRTAEAKGLIEQMNREIEIANRILGSNEDKLAFLSGEYRSVRAIDYIINVLHAGRAQDLNQALAMCDEQMHRWKLEEANEAMYAEMMSQSRRLKNIDRATTADAVVNLMRVLSK